MTRDELFAALVDEIEQDLHHPLLLRCGCRATGYADRVRAARGDAELWCSWHKRWEGRVNA